MQALNVEIDAELHLGALGTIRRIGCAPWKYRIPEILVDSDLTWERIAIVSEND